MTSKCARKSKLYTFDEDIAICEMASSPLGNRLSGGERNRQLAATLKRTAEGISTRIRALLGPVPGGCSPTRAATDNGVRLFGAPGNFTYTILDSTQPGSTLKHVRSAPKSANTVVLTINGRSVAGSTAEMWKLLNAAL